MGGGSSDAAAALVGLNRLWGLGLTEDTLEEIGLTIGADVPFCIRGGLQRAQGVGERLTPVSLKRPLYLAAFQPCRGLSTKEVFTSLHEDGILDSDRPDNEAAQSALMRGDVDALGRAMGNVLEPVSRRMRPHLDAAIRAIEESGACGARMTGSGSAVFGVYRHAGACKKAAEELKKTYPTCRMMKTAECGVVIEEV
jgi:4-diphosphocytidyl-2-C-methyl-D-erythritol kinase